MDTQKLLERALGLAPQVQQITDEVLLEHIQRQELIKVVWCGLVSGRPGFFLGGTGVDKTATIRAMAHRIDGAVFDERLIPAVRSFADLFVESTSVRERELADGKEIRLAEKLGWAANANIFFGDEFFKDEDHPVLNSLIDYALEGIVRHEGRAHKTPLMFFAAAGNEVPNPLGRLGAVWSRMTLRLAVKSLDRAGKKALVASRLTRYQEKVTGERSNPDTVMALADVQTLRDARPFVTVPDATVETVLDIYDELANRSDADFSSLLEDDRRFGRIFDAMQALALIGGRDTVANSDLGVLRWMLWDEPNQIPVLSEVLAPYSRTPLTEAQELVNALLSPSGAVEAAKSGNVSKGVEALSQLQAAVQQLDGLTDEAQRAGESAMAVEIETLCQQVQAEMDSIIAKMTGRA